MTVGQYVTTAGLIIPTTQDILASVAADQRAAIDPNLDTSPESPMGQINGTLLSHVVEVWEAIQIAYNGFNPDAAEDFLLDAVCKITGTVRGAATPSSFLGPRRLTVTLSATVTLAAGVLFSQAGNPAIVFRTIENVTSTTAGDYQVAALCTQVGPIACTAGTLTVIQTPTVGLSAVTNASDAILGTVEDTDATLRSRRLEELAIGELGNPAAITAALLSYTTADNVKPILSAVTYENTGDTYDSAGRPPHSIEALIYDGVVPAVDNDTIAQVIWDNRGGGIQTFGNSSGTAVDFLGVQRTVYFSRPTIQAIKLSLTIAYDASKPATDSAQVAAAMVVAHDANSPLGQSLVRWNPYDSAVQDNVPGALGSTGISLGFVGGSFLGNFTNMPLPARTKTTLQTSDVSVTLVAGAQ